MKLRAALNIALAAILLAGCETAPQTAGAPLTPPNVTSMPLPPGINDEIASLKDLSVLEFIDQSYIQLMLRDPDAVMLTDGVGAYNLENNRFTDISDAHLRETQALEVAMLNQLRTYDRAALNADEQIYYDAYEWYLSRSVQGHPYAYYNYLVTSDGYSKDQEAVYFMGSLRITDRKSAEDYIARLADMDTRTAQLLEGLKLREQAGVIPSRYMVQRLLYQVERGYADDVRADLADADENILWLHFRDELRNAASLSAEEKQNLLAQAKTEVQQTVIPSWLKLQEYFSYLLTIAPENPGYYYVPNGAEYYAYKLRRDTTTDMTAAEIHQLGLAEVKRLQTEMRKFAHAALDYPSDISMYELNQKMMRDPTVPSYELLQYDQGTYDRLLQKRSAYFNLFPDREVTLRIDANARALDYHTPLDAPGPVYFDLPLITSRAYFPVYFYHEYFPGHALSEFISYEQGAPFPIVHAETLFPGYVEGWATYTEQLIWEMGLYDEYPMSNLKRLELTLIHAAKMVAETGIHTQGWTLEEAAEYMSATTGQPTPPGDVLQLVSFPGYRCSYIVGYVKIMELRQRAQTQLGDRFDIREFHDTILKHGQMPLTLLEQVVDDWLETKAKGIK